MIRMPTAIAGLYIDSDHDGSCDHYAGIEATTTQPPRGSKAAIDYLANWGENGAVTLKRIYSLPVTDDPHHMMNDAYLVRF